MMPRHNYLIDYFVAWNSPRHYDRACWHMRRAYRSTSRKWFGCLWRRGCWHRLRISPGGPTMQGIHWWTWRHQIARRWFIGSTSQCAIQGLEFDPEVTEAVRRLLDWRGPPVRVLLPQLERQGLVKSVDNDQWTLWSFSRRLLQEVCYEMLALPERRGLHAKTAEALYKLAGGQDAVPPELLA